MFNDIVEVRDLLDSDFNLALIEILQNQRSWTIDPERKDPETYKNDITLTSYCDSGFVLPAYSKYQNAYLNNHNENLTIIAKLIFHSALMKLERRGILFKNLELDRVMFNYYNRSSCAIWHRDVLDKTNYCSFLYYLNTCDGYTEFEDRKIYSESGKGVFFDSGIRHKGVGPTEDKKRFTLNIVFEYEI